MSIRLSVKFLSILSVFLFSLCPLYAYTVLWDISHLAHSEYIPTVPNNYYMALSQELGANDFHIQITTTNFQASNLTGIDVAVISAPTSRFNNYSSDEITALQTFVDEGGGLLVMADFTNYALYSTLTDSFDISFTSAIEGGVTADILGSHPVGEGISDMYIQDGIGLSVSGSAQAAGMYNDTIVAASAEYGRGKVFVVGDSSLWSITTTNNYFNQADNPQFAVNVFEYLVPEQIPEPSTMLLLAAGSIMLKKRRRQATAFLIASDSCSD